MGVGYGVSSTGFRVSENAPDHIRSSMISLERESENSASGSDTSIPAKDLKIPVLGIFRHQLSFGRSLVQDETPPLVEASVPGPLDLEWLRRRRAGAPGAFCSPGGSGLCLGVFPG